MSTRRMSTRRMSTRSMSTRRMSTRRSYLAGVGLAAAGVTAAGLGLGATAAPAPARAQQPPPGDPPVGQPGEPRELVARRTELTLPDVPTLGLPYVCLLDLFDPEEAPAGTATAGAMVVGVTPEGPVVLASVVLHLADGEIHYQRVMDRFGTYPLTAVGAILGGTGEYRDLRGEVDISWPDEERIDLLVRPAGAPPP